MTLQDLIEQLNSPDAEVRQQAALALMDLADPTSRDALIASLQDESADVRRAVVRALSAINDDASAIAIVGMLPDRTPKVRRRVVSWLLKYADRKAIVPILLKLAADETLDYGGRDYAIMALGQGVHHEGVPLLADLLQNGPTPIRRRIAHSLMRLADERSVPALTHALADADAVVRKIAAEALRQIGNEAALAALANQQEDHTE
ncbi:MAG: hypothetical protein CL607_11715 [Anaerolineaceae bacterium]|nr:hypothetical protein [Anaerolineaceae bacterium]